MTLDFGTLRSAPADHPSDLALDRLLAGSLADDEADRLNAHCAGCPECSARVASFMAGFDAFDGVDGRAMLADFRRRAEAPPSPWSWLRRHLAVVAPVALVAAAAAVFLLRPTPPAPGSAVTPAGAPPVPVETVRVKGKARLHVFRNRGGQVREAQSGERFKAGDRLRFTVDLPAPGQVTVLGVETDGDLYTAWPLEPGLDTAQSAGFKQPLPGAVALDDAPGREVLWLVFCPDAQTAPVCASRGITGAPKCPEGCTLSHFVLNKGP